MSVVIEHLATIGATLLLLTLWIASGGRMLQWIHPRYEDWPAPMPLVTKALLGQGMCALLFLALGAIGLLTPPVVLGTSVLLLVLLRREVVALGSAVRRPAMPSVLVADMAIAAWVVMALLMIGLALTPPWEWDTLAYHQALPLEFLRSGAIRLPPDNFHIALIGIAQLAALPLLAAGLASGPAMASVASCLLLAGAVLGVARMVSEEEDGWWSVLLVLGTPVFFLVATTARIDVTVAGALLVAHGLMLLAWIRRQPSILVVAAICFGLAGGMKLHALAYAAVCAPLALFAWRDRRTLLVGLGAFTLALGPWLLKNALLVGAPFYPLGAPPRLEPWLAAIVGSDAIPPNFDTRVFGQLGESRAAFNLWDAFMHPAQLTIEGDEGRFYGLPLVLLLLPVCLYVLRRRPHLLGLALPPIAYVALIVAVLPRTNLRYLIPAIPSLLIVAVAGVRVAVPRLASPVGRRVLLGLILGAGAVVLIPAVKSRLGPDALLIRWLVGGVSREEVRARVPDVIAGTVVSLEKTLAGLEDDAQVLLFWEARTAGIRPRSLSDARLSNWPFLSQTAAADACLAGTGITHVVINLGSLRYYILRGASSDVFRVDQLQVFSRKCLVQSIEVPPYLVFRVRSGP